MGKHELAGTAYSYMRFSSPRQERGDSIRRQTEARDRWLTANPGVRLAADSDYRELGTSSFRGKHRHDDRTALRQFITAVETGRVKPGAFLIVESFDRLTREEFGEAAEFVLGLVNRGVRIVQLSPVEVVLEKPVDLTKALILVVELTRGHGESKRKSDTIGAAWAGKRAACRESGKVITKGGKAWLELRDGKFVFKPGAKPLVRRIFALATAGHGCRGIARMLNSEGVPIWTGKPWYEQYVRNLLRGREVLGEFQQARRRPDGKREFDGDPIPNYYPAALTEAEWQAAQAAARARDTGGGGRPTNRPEQVNVFAGLLRHAPTGERIHIHVRKGRRVLFPEGWKRRGDPAVSFPLDTFERAVLEKLRELDPREILDQGDGPDEVAELAAKLARLDSQIQSLADLFDGDDVVPEIAEKVRAKHAERKALAEELDRAKADAASPLSSSWGECRGLIEALDKAADQRDTRTRLRQAIARTVDSVQCYFVGGRNARFAAVQIHFAGGEQQRSYLISYAPRNRVGRDRYEVESFAGPAGRKGFDLRKHAAKLAAWLEANAG